MTPRPTTSRRPGSTTWRSTPSIASRSIASTAVGAEILDAPAEYDYNPGYYAAFFRDPDGFKLEVVHIP